MYSRKNYETATPANNFWRSGDDALQSAGKKTIKMYQIKTFFKVKIAADEVTY